MVKKKKKRRRRRSCNNTLKNFSLNSHLFALVHSTHSYSYMCMVSILLFYLCLSQTFKPFTQTNAAIARHRLFILLLLPHFVAYLFTLNCIISLTFRSKTHLHCKMPADAFLFSPFSFDSIKYKHLHLYTLALALIQLFIFAFLCI